jgi:hypothetical protein
MGGIIGGVAVQFGTLMSGSAFKGQLTQVLKDGAGFAKDFADGLVGMAGGLTNAASKAGPLVSAIGGGLKTLMSSGIPAFFQGLVSNAQGSGQTIKGLVDLVSSLLGPLGTIIGGLSGAFGPAIGILAPIVGDLGKKISDALLPVMGPLSDALSALATFLGQVILTLQPLLPMIATVLVGALKAVTPLLSFLADILRENHKWLMPLAGIILAVWSAVKLWTIAMAALNIVLLANPIVLLGAAIAALVVGLVYCWNHFSGFRDFVKQMWSDIKTWFFEAWHFIDDIWHKIADGATAAWKWVSDKWTDAVNIVAGLGKRVAGAAVGMWHGITDTLAVTKQWVSDRFDEVVGWVKDLPGRLARGAVGLWDWLGAGMKGAINAVIAGMNWVIDRINGMTGGLSDVWSWAGIPSIGKIDPLPTMKAAGGPVGGLAAIIGDAGVEAMRLPNGTVVMPHTNTSALLAGGGPASGAATTVRLEWAGGAADREFMTWLRRNIRVVAGNGPNSVQRALGQSF